MRGEMNSTRRDVSAFYDRFVSARWEIIKKWQVLVSIYDRPYFGSTICLNMRRLVAGENQ